MKDLLRKCYQDAGIKGANAKRFEDRAAAIQQILEDKNFFSKENWTLLAKWVIGAVENSAVEEQLIDLEEAFCETDSDYSNDNTKELHILVEMLLYQYCKETENLLLPAVIVCGHGVGWKLKSSLLYEKFLAFTNEVRLALRQLDQCMLTDTLNTRASMQMIKAQLELTTDTDEDEEGEEEDATVDTDQLATNLGVAEEQIEELRRQSRVLALALTVQREESDILWWVLSEWSETSQKSFRNMSKGEAALLSAYELSNNVSFFLGPYASREVLTKMISLGKTEEKECFSAVELIDQLDEKLSLSFEDCSITELQPLLFALDTKKNAAQKGKADEWQRYYELTCEKDLKELSLTAFDFGWQLYLEIELGKLLHAEGSGE